MSRVGIINRGAEIKKVIRIIYSVVIDLCSPTVNGGALVFPFNTSTAGAIEFVIIQVIQFQLPVVAGIQIAKFGHQHGAAFGHIPGGDRGVSIRCDIPVEGRLYLQTMTPGVADVGKQQTG